VSGHEPLAPDGTPANLLGKVPTEVSLEHAQSSARLAALEMLASLKSVLGDLDRVVSWLTVVSFVNTDPDYASIDLVMSPVSDLILALYGPEVGSHERRAVAVSPAPLNLPVAIVAEIEIRN
jgi:enamine deaminase RidA (YjgF/YER057c/UK114 family)